MNRGRYRHASPTVSGIRLAINLIYAAILLAAPSGLALAQAVPTPRPDPAALIAEARAHGNAGRWDEAASSARLAVAVLRAGGAPAGHLAIALNDYAQNLRNGGDPGASVAPAAEALELAKSLDGSGKATAVFAYNHGAAALDSGAPKSARESLELAVRLFEGLGESGALGRSMSALGSAHMALGDYGTALEAFKRAESLSEAEGGMALTLLRAQALVATGDVPAARQEIESAESAAQPGAGSSDLLLAKAGLDIASSQFGMAEERLGSVLSRGDMPESLQASAHYKLGEVYLMTGRYAEAEESTRRALSIYESVVAARHQIFGSIFHRLAIIRQEFGDHENAEQLYLRARRIFGEALGDDHPITLDTRLERVRLLVLSERTSLAIQEASEAKALLEMNADSSAKASRRRGISEAVLALALFKSDQRMDAAASAFDAISTFEDLGRAGLLDMTPSLNLLAEISLEQGQIEDARIFAERAFEVQQTTSAVSPDRSAESRRLLAEINLQAGNRSEALALARDNVNAVRQRLRELSRRTSLSAEFRTGAARRQIGQLVRILIQVRGETSSAERHAIDAELFDAVQLLSVNQSAKALNAAVAKKQVAPGVAELIDSRQQLAGRLLGLLRLSEQAALDDGADAVTRFAELQREVVELEAELGTADRQLEAAAPEFFSLVTPKTRDLKELQAALAPSQALWMNASFDDGTLLLAVSDTGLVVHWDQTLTSGDLDEIVTALRSVVAELSANGYPPEFQPEYAEALYRALFLPVESVFADLETLFLVPDGAAQQIPLGIAMVPGKVGADSFIGLQIGMAVLPSVESLIVLPDAGRAARDGGVFGGFGNPLFGDDEGSARPEDLRRALAAPKGYIEDSRALKFVFSPLPETEFELSYLADQIGTAGSRLFFRENATEARVKSEDLSDVSVLAFATHAVASGEFDGSNEPGLALSPPDTGSSYDDGFLSASEVAQLRLSADLVILSACNTGSPALRSGADGLSGLARAFFHAGARSLLVSHWAVNSEATVYITTQWAEVQRKNPGIGRIEAFRTTLDAMARGEFNENFSHPYYWAPFILVGV